MQNKGFKNIKVNAVLLKNVNDSLEEFQNWERFINNNEIDFRYIELMQTGDNLEYFKKYHTSASNFRKYIESTRLERNFSNQ